MGEFYESAVDVSANEGPNVDLSICEPNDDTTNDATIDELSTEQGQEGDTQPKESLFELPDLTDTLDDLPNLIEPDTEEIQQTSTSELAGVKFAQCQGKEVGQKVPAPQPYTEGVLLGEECVECLPENPP